MALRNLFGSKFEVIPSGVPHAEPGYPDKDTNKRGQKASGPLFAFVKTKSKIRMGRERKTNGPVWTETLYLRRFRIGIFARIRLCEALAEFFRIDLQGDVKSTVFIVFSENQLFLCLLN
ncbi:hypothetical protein [uncultured Alistipes sp.]|uniref:hypothetical protein n=1 Tax=uncultured Alistipes sp. TaxID=538949 RepID=UPI00261B7CF3|nr:hypothetical protein [uncultured Alistipes sp.]